MDKELELEMTDKQALVHTIAKGVLAVTASILARVAVEKTYNKALESRYSTDTADEA